jgi:hypothetical protein
METCLTFDMYALLLARGERMLQMQPPSIQLYVPFLQDL